MIPGLIQNRPLLISNLIEFASKLHGDVEIVSRITEDLSIHRTNYREVALRSKKIALALTELLGAKQGW